MEQIYYTKADFIFIKKLAVIGTSKKRNVQPSESSNDLNEFGFIIFIPFESAPFERPAYYELGTCGVIVPFVSQPIASRQAFFSSRLFD